MEVLIFPDSRLRKVSEPVKEFNEELKKIADEMIVTMKKSKGIGLAAPQVGIYLNLIINKLYFEDENPEKSKELVIMVNPEILEKKGKVILEEGCLSTPGIYANVERDSWIKVQFQDLEGKTHLLELDGYKARMALHETDHLKGKIFLDYLGVAQRNLLTKKLKKSLKN